LGDCHLVTLFGKNKAKYKILIDCGVILGTPNAKALMTGVMDDIRSACDGRVDLLVATHEHWDHVSGFAQAADSFAELEVGGVWMAWTENPEDPQAQQLAASKASALSSLRQASLHLNMSDRAGEPALFESLSEFFGMAAGPTTRDCFEAVRAKAGESGPRYCDPSDPPIELANVGARIFVLGPPRDMALLKRINPKKNGDESYDEALKAFGASVAPALGDNDEQAPFALIDSMPLDGAKGIEFFQRYYFDGPAWRRIDSDWMLGADELALALDNMTNNTSLVLAIELGGKDVLLFAADAQVGNWLSWPEHKWTVQGKEVTGEDLLRRTTVYKVGHHGSHNATLKARGLELMDSLQVAIIPVDREMALKKRWGAMPLVGLIDALDAKTGSKGVVARTDQDLPSGAQAAGVRATDQYFEITV
jgi:hypothetical protein